MSISTTATFTITSARYLTSKIAADLRSLHNIYGKPSLHMIGVFAEEAALLLNAGCLDRVDYGFKAPAAYGGGVEWVLRLRYRVTAGAQRLDALPGGVPVMTLPAGATWASYLVTNDTYVRLAPADRDALDRSLPITRTGQPEAGTAAGINSAGRDYHRHGTGIARDDFVVL